MKPTYWCDVDPPMSFIPEGWTYEEKRKFRYDVLDYLPVVMPFTSYAGKRVLCVGDGSGIDAVEFARGGALVNVVDMSDKAVALTRQHAKEAGVDSRVAAYVEDATALHFEPSAFDAVYSFGVIHHIPEVDKAVAEIARVLRPGGQFFGMVYHKDSLYYAYSILARAAKERITPDEAMRLYSERNPGCPHSVAYTRDELRGVLGPHFGEIDMVTMYDVIDLPERRKVRVRLEYNGRTFDHDLGWHLIFRATK